MRVVFECYAVYSALLCSVLCVALALNLDHHHIEMVAKYSINVSFLIYGPVLFTVCMLGFYNHKALTSVCLVNGISPGTNYVNLFVLVIAAFFGLMTCLCMAFEQTVDMARVAFTNEDSLLFRISTMYF